MIIGIGVDMVTISRVTRIQQRFGDRFARRILHTIELEEYRTQKQPDRFLAKRFATKEAAVKALGTGEREGVLLRDFYIRHNSLGKPILEVSGQAKKRFSAQGITSQHVSLSDEEDHVIAFVVLEQTHTQGY